MAFAPLGMLFLDFSVSALLLFSPLLLRDGLNVAVLLRGF